MRHRIVRNYHRWGTYGKNPDLNNLRLEWVKIKDLSNNHIAAILRTQYQIPLLLRNIFREELIYRTMAGIEVAEVERYYAS